MMFVEGYRLVRPGREAEVGAALARRRRASIAGGAVGVVIGVAVPVLGYALLIPWVASQGLEPLTSPLVWVAPAAVGLLCGALAWLLISGAGERRWERVKTDPDLVRDGFAIYDYYGGVPTSIPPQELWDALDTPDGIRTNPLSERIMFDLWGRGEDPASKGATNPGSAP